MRHSVPARPSATTRVAGGAFTLIETSLATIIVGVGVLAAFEAHNSFLQKNAWSTHTSTATFLANEIREMSRNFPRHDAFSGGLYFEDQANHTGFRGWGAEPDEILSDPDTGAVLGFDFDDVDDFDGCLFGDATTTITPSTRRLDGPIDAFGAPIQALNWTGELTTDADGEPVSLVGWSQHVRVEKVDFSDFSDVLPDEHFAPAGASPEIPVDAWPLRVTVTVLHQGPLDSEARVITQVSWVVPQ